MNYYSNNTFVIIEKWIKYIKFLLLIMKKKKIES